MADRDKKKKISEHREKILNAAKAKTQPSKGYFKNDDTKFLRDIEFKDTLPVAPSGPYFKKVGLSGDTGKEYCNYEVSTLVRNMIWPPHFEDTGMRLKYQLADKNAALYGECATEFKHDIEQETRMYLAAALERGGKVNNKVEHAAAHWWLRDAKYDELGVVQKDNKKIKDDAQNDTDEKDLWNSEIFINDSFTAVGETVYGDITWSIPIIPDQSMIENSLCLAKFDADPVDHIASGEDIPVGSKRICSSIISNIRPSKKSTGELDYSVSLVVEDITTDEDESESDESIKSYKWLKDYQMGAKKDVNQFLFINDMKDGGSKFSAVETRLELNRLPKSEIMPIDCTVVISK